MGKPISGVGLAMMGMGSALVYAGMMGYSLAAVIQNLVSGKPIMTGVIMPVKPSVTTPPKGGVKDARIDRGDLQ